MLIDPVATYGKARGSATALVDLATGRRWSWAEFDSAVNRVSHLIIASVGSCSGARVATLARNCADMILLQFGCMRAGAIFVPVNWRLAPSEVEVILDDAEPSILFIDVDLKVEGCQGRRLELAELATLSGDHGDSAPPAEARQPWDSPSTLLYTSGTSGRPKGVMISEANAYWGSTNFMLGNAVSSESTFLCDLPLFHTAGLFGATRTPILAGGTVLISRTFEPANTLRALADPALAITHYFSVPQMAQMLWNHPDFDAKHVSRLKVYSTGGAPNPAAQIERFVRAGVPMSDGFGMTEIGSASGMPVGEPDLLVEKAGSCGLPLVSLETRIIDNDGCDVPDGQIGELIVRGPSVTGGYWKQPEMTAKAFIDGWFCTGDAARRDDDGFLYLVDRKKDMFISGGENVFPAEVEAAIAEMGNIAECAVVGVADERWGEVGWAYVIPKPEQVVTADDVMVHCKVRLAAFKVPKVVVVTDTIPRTASGKVQKHILRGQPLHA